MKRLLALTLAVLMILCAFAGCNSDDQNDEKPNAGDITNNPNAGDNTDKPIGLLMGISVGEPGELLKIFTGENPIADIKDVYLEMAANDNAELIYGLGAQLFGEKHALKLFYGENVVISAPSLMDENYGISLDALMDMITGQNAPDIEEGVNTSAPMSSSMLLELVPVLAKYGDDLVAELKTNAGLTVTENGGKVNIKGTVTSDAAAVVFSNLLVKLYEDDDFMAIMSVMSGQSIEDMRKEMPEKDVMIAEFKKSMAEANFSAGVDLTLEKGTDALKAMNVSVNVGSEAIKINVAFDAEKETFSFSALENNFPRVTVTYADGKLDFDMQVDGQVIEGSLTVSEKKISGFVKMAGEELGRLSIDILDDGFDFKLNYGQNEIRLTAKEANGEVTLTLLTDGVEAGSIVFVKEVSGTKTTFTVKSLSVSGVTLDLSAAKLSFYIDTDYTLEKAPAFESLEDKSEAELEAILQKIATDNQALIEKIAALFPQNVEPDVMTAA